MLQKNLWILWILAIALLALVGGRIAAQERVWLKNGDRLTGKVLKVDGKKLVLKARYGEVKIKLGNVKALESERALKVELGPDQVFVGKLTVDDKGQTVLEHDGQRSAVDNFASVTSIADPKEFPKWNAQVFASGVASGGNTREKAMHIDANVTGRWKKTRLAFDAAADYGEAFGEVTTRKAHAQARGDYFFSGPYYGYVRYRAENDKFQSIRLRSIAGLGLGWEVFNNDDGLLDLALGSSYITEDLMDNQPDYGYATADLTANFSYKIYDGVTFGENLIGFQSLKNEKDLRLVSTTSLAVSITSFLAWEQKFVVEWNNTPAEDTKRTDWRYLTGLTFKLF
jgi:putative salt-induced outer membrane protein YdiY